MLEVGEEERALEGTAPHTTNYYGKNQDGTFLLNLTGRINIAFRTPHS